MTRKPKNTVSEEKSTRIVFKAPPETVRRLEKDAKALHISKVATIRYALSIFSEIMNELQAGGKLVLKDKNSAEREIWIPRP